MKEVSRFPDFVGPAPQWRSRPSATYKWRVDEAWEDAQPKFFKTRKGALTWVLCQQEISIVEVEA